MFIRFSILLLVSLCFSGCSVFMAASSQEEKDLSSIVVGMDRSAAEAVLGKPMSVLRDSKGDIATYVYVSHDEQSYERAATYAVLDGITLGLAELVTFPIEALQGRKNEVKVIYDRKNQVRSITHFQHDAVVEKPEKTLGWDKEREA